MAKFRKPIEPAPAVVPAAPAVPAVPIDDPVKHGLPIPGQPEHPALTEAINEVAARAEAARAAEGHAMERMIGLSCRRCHSPFTRVLKRRAVGKWFRRRRQCTSCGFIFWTREESENEQERARHDEERDESGH